MFRGSISDDSYEALTAGSTALRAQGDAVQELEALQQWVIEQIEVADAAGKVAPLFPIYTHIDTRLSSLRQA